MFWTKENKFKAVKRELRHLKQDIGDWMPSIQRMKLQARIKLIERFLRIYDKQANDKR